MVVHRNMRNFSFAYIRHNLHVFYCIANCAFLQSVLDKHQILSFICVLLLCFWLNRAESSSDRFSSSVVPLFVCSLSKYLRLRDVLLNQFQLNFIQGILGWMHRDEVLLGFEPCVYHIVRTHVDKGIHVCSYGAYFLFKGRLLRHNENAFTSFYKYFFSNLTEIILGRRGSTFLQSMKDHTCLQWEVEYF